MPHRGGLEGIAQDGEPVLTALGNHGDREDALALVVRALRDVQFRDTTTVYHHTGVPHLSHVLIDCGATW